MRNFATKVWPLTRARVLALAIMATLLDQQRLAYAQACAIPDLRPPVCADASIDGYKTCYRELYDDKVIPAFESMAKCTHLKAAYGISQVLEASAALVTGAIKKALKDVDDVMNASTGAPLTCIGSLNAVQAALEPYIDDERRAGTLDAFRRATYTPAHFSFFEDAVLKARQSRAACDPPLQKLRKQLVLLSELKAHHPDYCQILRDSAKYESVSRIEGLADWTSVDPDIHFGSYFNFLITWNSQCGYYDFGGVGQGTIRSASCTTLTVEYKQTLSGMDGTLGWLARNRDMIVATSTTMGIVIAGMWGAGLGAGPIGAAIGAAVGALIAGVEYVILQYDINSFKELIAAKQQRVKDVVAANLITEPEFDALITQSCEPWRSTVEQRVAAMIASFDFPKHLRMIDSYYSLSDSLHNWYNELFLWATRGVDGRTFLDDVAKQDLLTQKDQFEQRIFSARADQEIAAQSNELTNVKGTVTQLACSNLAVSQRRAVRSKLNAGVTGFNGKCRDVMEALAVRTDRPVAFAASTLESDIVCVYRGFRNGITTVEVRSGQGAASNMSLKDASGSVIAEIANVSSDTDFSQLAALPGFSCASASRQPFGISAATRLAEGTYPLRLQDNLFGVDDGKAATMRPTVQTLDAQLRLKVISCSRQLGNTTFSIPRTAEACGIPQSL